MSWSSLEGDVKWGLTEFLMWPMQALKSAESEKKYGITAVLPLALGVGAAYYFYPGQGADWMGYAKMWGAGAVGAYVGDMVMKPKPGPQ